MKSELRTSFRCGIHEAKLGTLPLVQVSTVLVRNVSRSTIFSANLSDLHQIFQTMLSQSNIFLLF
jgi:hypothetical protein